MYKVCPLFEFLLNQSDEQRTCLIDSTSHTLQNFAQEFRQSFQKGLLKFLLKSIKYPDPQLCNL